MLFAAWSIVLAVVAAQPAPAKTVSFSVWAVHASHEDRPSPYFDEGLDAIRGILEVLPFFNTYREVYNKQCELQANSDRKTSETMQLDDRYTLSVTLNSQEADGHVRLELRVEAASKTKGEPPVRVLTTRLRMKPGEMAAVRGLRRGSTETILVFRCDPKK